MVYRSYRILLLSAILPVAVAGIQGQVEYATGIVPYLGYQTHGSCGLEAKR